MKNELSDRGSFTPTDRIEDFLNHFPVRFPLSFPSVPSSLPRFGWNMRKKTDEIGGGVEPNDAKRKARSVANLQNIGLFPTQKPIFKLTRIDQ